jgi:hypothetical protein
MAGHRVLDGCAAAPNSLFASLRWHLCRSFNQAAGACLVNAAMSKTSGVLRRVWDFLRMRCKMVTSARIVIAVLLAVAVSGCTWVRGNDDLSYTADRGVDDQPFPANYRPELLAFLRTYLNDPRGVKDAAIAQPAQRKVGGRQRYVVCVRFNMRVNGAYPGVKERAAMYIDGRFDRMIEDAGELCEGMTYAPFPEMEKLAR